ncbi:low molecular weight phosphatase family protein [Knoellia sp. CPCC 206450]|uniref:arsenate reductase/protein-tyrosine-phosphatase family protein n=1 Tax=Knoellia tibetensis TaxID=3404798 RepID=UPI003B43AEE6
MLTDDPTRRRTRRERRPETLRVLFVCTANISRSPYAERRARQLAEESSTPSPLDLSSAGVPGFPGNAMDPAMAHELEARGADGRGHLSRAVSGEILAAADVVLALELAHRLRITERWPEHAPKVFGLRQLADALTRSTADDGGLAALDAALAVAGPDSLGWDVTDPFGQGSAAARRCAAEIDEALDVIVPRLAGIRVASGN